MKGAFSLGRILGIKVYIHFTFFFIFIWQGYVAFSEGFGWLGMMIQFFVVATVFLCVLLHEYGHALAARRYGIQTKRIVLLPIGGVAQLEKMPQNPKQELVVSLAGPFVNVIIIAILLPILLFNFSFHEIFSSILYIISRGYYGTASNDIADNIPFILVALNSILVVFNMLPAFPMDGGRVLRALLGFKLDFTLSTKIAARIGQAMAIGFIILGIYYNFFFILIGAFVFFGAEMELRMAGKKYISFGFSIRDALVNDYLLLDSQETVLNSLAKIAEDNTETDFLVGENGKITGFISREKLLENVAVGNENLIIEEIMQHDLPEISVNDSLDQVLQFMRLYNTTVLPVYEDDFLIGLISQKSIQEQILLQKMN